MRNAAHEKTVRRFFIFQNWQRRLVKIGNELRHFLLLRILGVARLDGGNGIAFAVRVGVGQRAFEPLAAEHHDKAVFLASLDDDLRVADLLDLRGKQGDEPFARLGGNAAGATVRDNSLRVERGEVGAGADVAGLQLNAQPERLNDTAAHLKFQRVVAEKPEMPRPAARRDARRRGDQAALRGKLRKGVKVRR